MDKLTYEELVKLGSIRKLGELEKKDYIKFYKDSWKEDLAVAETLVEKSPKWSIISGYYAMHDLAKLFLATKGIKVSGKFVHVAVIEALRSVIEKEESIKLMEDAFEKVKFLPEFLEFARAERSKAQYYSKRLKTFSVREAREFLDDIVKPFIKNLKELIKDV